MPIINKLRDILALYFRVFDVMPESERKLLMNEPRDLSEIWARLGSVSTPCFLPANVMLGSECKPQEVLLWLRCRLQNVANTCLV